MSWKLDGGLCPCGGALETDGERVWCVRLDCGYERECGDWTCRPVAAEVEPEEEEEQ